MTDIRVCLHPSPSAVEPESGVGRVIQAMARTMAPLGFQFIDDPHRADIIACHIHRPDSFPRVDVLHTHGLYFADLPHLPYQGWHNSINRAILQTARESLAVTVPSQWVAEPFRRDMRINPVVIGHGVDLDEWQQMDHHLGYVLWNKNRLSDVCDPMPALQMALRGVEVMTTFPPKAGDVPQNLHVTGLLSAQKMHAAVGFAEAYLATTPETFGIGTVEALACGVPVLGYRWGALPDIVRHGVEGFLVEPGDLDGLMAGLAFIRQHRAELSANAKARAKDYTWERAASQYANLYRSVLAMRETEDHGVSVVVPCHNYASFLPECVASLQSQTHPPAEIILVDDCSTDNSVQVMQTLAQADSRIKIIQHAKNQGVAASRNDGIAAAAHPYIICLDADDQLKPPYIETCARALEADRSLGIVYTGLEILFENGQRGQTSWPPDFDWELMTAVSVPPSNCIPSAAMFRKSMWARAGGYQQVHAPAEDTEFWVRGLSVGFNARKVSSDGLFLYRAHAGSASRTKTYHAIDQWHPWMRDKEYPMGAPNQRRPIVRSYALPGVSVIIPVGPNHAQYLPAALDSLLGQTLRDWEVVVMDDTGQPGALEAVLGPYPFVHLVSTGSKPLGAGFARNLGLKHARASLCLFLDADDFLDPQALEKMAAKFAESEGRYVYTDWVSFDAEGTHSAFALDDYDPLVWVRRLCSGEGGLNGITVLMATNDARRIGFDESLPGFEDSDFFARCAIKGIHGARLPEPLLYYRVYSGSRRLAAQGEKERLLKLFQKRYGPYLKGEKPMGSCCGGSGGNALLNAKRMISGEPLQAVEAAPASGSERVKMEFVGSETGPVPYRGAKGDVYRGANSPLHRFAMVHPEDVEKLEGTGKWKRVLSQTQQAAALPVAPPAPVKTVEELRREAEAALIAAKAAAEQLAAETDQKDPADREDPSEIAEPAGSEPEQAPVAEAPKESAPKKRSKKASA